MNLDRTSDIDCGCDTARATGPVLDPRLATQSDRFFSSFRAEAYKCVRPTEKDVLALPWGPRLDVMFDPKGAPGIVGGRVRVMARSAGTEVEIANVLLASAEQPVALTAMGGCDEYVIRASLGSDPGANTKRIESYIYARVYNGR